MARPMVLNGPANGTQRSGPWATNERPMSLTGPTHEPPPTPPKGERYIKAFLGRVYYYYQ